MKCPKCGYLGFEHVERCRNCGYEFALSTASTDVNLRLRDTGARSSLALDDLALGAPPQAPDLADASISRRDRLTTKSAGELPLFPKSAPDEVLVTPSAGSRPLSVRRASPEVRKARADRPATPMLDLAEVEAPPRTKPVANAPHPTVDSAPSPHRHEPVPLEPSAERSEPAGMVSRVVAAAIDLLVLGTIDAVVVYFTLRICGLTVADIGRLPKLPLGAFLAVQNLSYLVAFTAGGQTLGKMATGIRVVSASSEASLDLAHAAVRSTVWALLALPAGLGLLTAWLADDRRGWHDRCAGARVVRANAV